MQLQLYDVHADPSEADDLLAPSSATALGAPATDAADAVWGARAVLGARGARRNTSVRERREVAATMLGHYLSAVRVARRSIERAKGEGRDGHPQGRGYEMVVWFCRQVELSWRLERWRETAVHMCVNRPEAERRAIPLGGRRSGVAAARDQAIVGGFRWSGSGRFGRL